MLVPVNRIIRGFTLIELVIGIVLFSIVLTLVTTLVAPQARRSVDPILQIRAVELAQSVLREISARSFDENSDRINGVIRCNEDLNDDGEVDPPPIGDEAEKECTANLDLGNEAGESRATFDDVDDYDGLSQSGGDIENSLGDEIIVDGANLYEGFSVQVNVEYAGDFYDPGRDNENSKLITVTVTTPTGVDLVFSTYRSNF